MSNDVQVKERAQYANKLELMLTLVGYAVGLGNIWRFPYLAYTYGGGAFLIPYALALCLLGLPLFVLELGLGQMLRQGTLGVWARLGLPRLRGVGAAATTCTFLVSLYYNVIIAWTVYYIGRTLGALFSGGRLPWATMGDGGEPCPEIVLHVRSAVALNPYLIKDDGLFNRTFADDLWCPAHSGGGATEIPPGYAERRTRPAHCPGVSAVRFWQEQALQQTSGLDELGGFHPGMLLSFTFAWVLIYFCIFNGVKSSGKVVYFTAILPYFALVCFFLRAVTLPNAGTGVRFFLEPHFADLLRGQVWMRAVTQIFYSLGVGFGSLVAFASYGSKKSNFVKDATTVSLINCGTSVFAGFVVFPILGYLAHELSTINPCIRSDTLSDLDSIGLSGTGLAFIAFPVAMTSMPGGFFWALMFFGMLILLGVGSQFALVESIITVLSDAGIGRSWPRPKLAAAVCSVMYALGAIFVTRGGIYWFQLFDEYACVVALFFVTFLECVGLMWRKRSTWEGFEARVKIWTGIDISRRLVASWRFVCPSLLTLMAALSFRTWDVMDARKSRRFPEGKGFYPEWSIFLGWFIGIVPVLVALAFALVPKAGHAEDLGLGENEADIDADLEDEKAPGADAVVSEKQMNAGLAEFRFDHWDGVDPETIGNGQQGSSV